MPANKKYLSSPFQRFLKITAGFLGGYFVMLSFHLLLTYLITTPALIITACISGYILWAFLLLVAFLAENGWRIWFYYLLLSALFFGLFYLKFYEY